MRCTYSVGPGEQCGEEAGHEGHPLLVEDHMEVIRNLLKNALLDNMAERATRLDLAANAIATGLVAQDKDADLSDRDVWVVAYRSALVGMDVRAELES